MTNFSKNGIYFKNSGSSENEELTDQELGRMAAVHLESQQQEHRLCLSKHYLPPPLSLPCAITHNSNFRRQDLIGPAWVVPTPAGSPWHWRGGGVLQLAAVCGTPRMGKGQFFQMKGKKSRRKVWKGDDHLAP